MQLLHEDMLTTTGTDTFLIPKQSSTNKEVRKPCLQFVEQRKKGTNSSEIIEPNLDSWLFALTSMSDGHKESIAAMISQYITTDLAPTKKSQV